MTKNHLICISHEYLIDSGDGDHIYIKYFLDNYSNKDYYIDHYNSTIMIIDNDAFAIDFKDTTQDQVKLLTTHDTYDEAKEYLTRYIMYAAHVNDFEQSIRKFQAFNQESLHEKDLVNEFDQELDRYNSLDEEDRNTNNY